MNFPTLPDTLIKFLVLIGFFVMIWSRTTTNTRLNEMDAELNNDLTSLKRWDYQTKSLYKEREYLVNNISQYAIVKKLKNPLTIKDSIVIVNPNIGSEIAMDETLSILLNKFRLTQNKIDSIIVEVDIQHTLLGQLGIERKSLERDFNDFYLGGSLVFMLALFMWNRDDKVKENIKKRQNLALPFYTPICQSCGKHFSSVIKYGNEAEDKPNYNFCLQCYKNGEYTEPLLTLNEMVSRIETENKNNKTNKLRSSLIISRVKSLDRWKNDHF